MGPNSFNDKGLDHRGWSRVHYVVASSDVELLRLLLDTMDGSAVNLRAGPDSWTPLMCAATAYEASATAQLLIERKASLVAACLSTKQTAVHYAAVNCKVKILRLLITAKADVNSQDASCDTPLMRAAQQGFSRVVRLLLEHKAATDWTNLAGDTAMSLAVSYGNESCVDLLTAHAGKSRLPDTKHEHDEDGFNAKGYNLDTRHRLHDAAKSNDVKAIASILAAGGIASVDLPECESFSPLHVATEVASLEAAKLLLESKADIEAEDQYRERPLHHAVRSGVDMVRLLLKRRAMIDCKTQQGSTPLMLAAESNYTAVAQLLLASRADPTIKSQWAHTAANFAELNNHANLAQLLIDACANWTSKTV